MDGVLATLAIYRAAFARGGMLALGNWLVLGSAFAYGFLVIAALQVAVLLGPLGGFLITLVLAACAGSFLYLVEMMVRTSRVSLADFRRSFGVYLGDVIGVMFVLWIGFRLLDLAMAGLPQGGLIILCAHLVVLVLFNAVPELIYLGHHSALELLSESYRFIADNWIEWFPPNVILGGVLLGVWSFPVEGQVAFLAKIAVAALLLYLAMVIRGLLFLELLGTSRRGRIFRHRVGR